MLSTMSEDTTQTQTPSPAPEPRRLTRSTSDRIFGGVCGGLGAYLGVDPVIVRVVAVVLAFIGGAGVLLYVAAWLLVPSDEPGARSRPGRCGSSRSPSTCSRSSLWLHLRLFCWLQA